MCKSKSKRFRSSLICDLRYPTGKTFECKLIYSMKYICLHIHVSMSYGWSGSSIQVATTGRPKECRTITLQGTGDYET